MPKKSRFKLDETGHVFENVAILRAKSQELAEKEKALWSEIQRLEENSQGIGVDASPEDVIRFLDTLDGENTKQRISELRGEVRRVQNERKQVQKVLDRALWEANRERVRQLKPQVAALARDVLPALEQAKDALKAFEEARFEAGQLAPGGHSEFVSFGRLSSRLIDAVIRNVETTQRAMLGEGG